MTDRAPERDVLAEPEDSTVKAVMAYLKWWLPIHDAEVRAGAVAGLHVAIMGRLHWMGGTVRRYVWDWTEEDTEVVLAALWEGDAPESAGRAVVRPGTLPLPTTSVGSEDLGGVQPTPIAESTTPDGNVGCSAVVGALLLFLLILAGSVRWF